MDRYYLPYPSARLYQDRKMAKWMGFFLSEHTSALQSEDIIFLSHCLLTDEQRLLLLNQAFLQGLEVTLVLEKEEITGTITDLSIHETSIKSIHENRRLNNKDIWDIRLSQ